MIYTHVTAPTQFIETNGIRFAYRLFGKDSGVPLVFMQHFRGGMDNWDPAVTDGFAKDRPVILFDNAGVGGSSGETPHTIVEMSAYAIDFISALGIKEVDILGFSIGGCIAQEFVLRNPELVRRLLLVCTGPRGGEPTQDVQATPYLTGVPKSTTEELNSFLYLFFSQSKNSQAAGKAFFERRTFRTSDVDTPTSQQTMNAQLDALAEWGLPLIATSRRDTRTQAYQESDKQFIYLRSIAQPTLVVSGNRDLIIPAVNSFILSQYIANAQLIIYPDSGHGAIFQYSDLFLEHARIFLDSTI